MTPDGRRVQSSRDANKICVEQNEFFDNKPYLQGNGVCCRRIHFATAERDSAEIGDAHQVSLARLSVVERPFLG